MSPERDADVTAARADANRAAALAVAPLAEEQERLLACVHCGFCLNACPTYTRLGDESDSPRGRLYLMRAVVEGRLDPGASAFRTHIDRCLGCRACEPVCPSGVQYGFLLERARQSMARAAAGSLLARAILLTMESRPLSWLFAAGGRALRGSGIAGLLARVLPERFGKVRLSLAMLASSRSWRGLRRPGRARTAERAAVRGPADVPLPAVGQNREVADLHAHYGLPAGTSVLDDAGVPGLDSARPLRVAVLEGCVQRGLFGRVNDATARVLRANGCDVVAAPGQRCCGALHAHSGDLETMRRLARANIDAFEQAGADVIAVNAAGCGALMKEYAEQFERDPALRDRAAGFSSRVRDVSELLVELGPRSGAPVHLRVTYDAACHLIHAQRVAHAPLDMLAAVPGLEIVPLPGSEECCGGAGIYGLQHPELAGRILADKVAAIRATGAESVLTGNPGCMMQIGAGLILDGAALPVLHPIEILDESYRRQSAVKLG